MLRHIFISTAIALSITSATAQNTAPPAAPAFDVATIRTTSPTEKGRYITMQGTHRFIAQAYTLKLLIAAAYELNPRAISGGAEWVDVDHVDITAITPGETLPTHDQQMAMLRALLVERFKLTFHREQKVFSIYELTVLPGGIKFKPTTAAPGTAPQVISTVYPGRIHMPARNITMTDFTSVLQRAILDRPVVDSTHLTARYNFDLDWTPDETQFSGAFPSPPKDATQPPLFTALQEQLGLKLTATHGPISALVIDHAEKPILD